MCGSTYSCTWRSIDYVSRAKVWWMILFRSWWASWLAMYLMWGKSIFILTDPIVGSLECMNISLVNNLSSVVCRPWLMARHASFKSSFFFFQQLPRRTSTAHLDELQRPIPGFDINARLHSLVATIRVVRRI